MEAINFLFIVTVALIAAVIAIFVFIVSAPINQTPSTPNFNGSGIIPGAVNGRQFNTSDIAQHLYNEINSSKAFSINYSGKVVAGVYTAPVGLVTVTVPISYSFIKFGNDTRSTLAESDVPYLGNSTKITIVKGNLIAYTCSKTSSSVYGFNCTQSAPYSQVVLLYSIFGALANNTLRYAVASSYHGEHCVATGGTATIPPSALSSAFGGSEFSRGSQYFNFTDCLSQDTYIPLNLSLAQIPAANGTYVSIYVHITSFNAPVTENEVLTLPGRVTNAQ